MSDQVGRWTSSADQPDTGPTRPVAEIARLLYLAGLDREPDPDGLAYWVARLEAGEPLDALWHQLLATPEAMARRESARTDGPDR